MSALLASGLIRRVQQLPVALLLLMSASLVAWAQTGGERVALVIGNGQYVHAAPLATPPRDARTMAEELRQLGFEVLEGIDLDKAATEEMLRQFAARVEDADVALFYYAGHGLQVYGRNYLAPVDAKLEQQQDLYFEAIDMGFILRLMEKDPRTSLIFLDACRDNPLARNLARGMGSQAVGRGLAQIVSGVGTLIAFAQQPNHVADDGTGEYSPFTDAVVQYVDDAGLELRQMLSRVRETVVRNTGGRQVPWDHSSLTEDFYFVPEEQVAARTDAGVGQQRDQAPPARMDVDTLERDWLVESSETATTFVAKHPYSTAVLLSMTFYLLSLAIIWIMRPILILPINRGLRFDFTLPGNLGGVSLPLRFLLLIGFLNYRPRVLDAWVAQHLPTARRNFEAKRTVQARSVHVPLPVELDRETVPDLKGRDLLEVFGPGGPGRLLIWGEGGIGKTSLACQIARWAMSDRQGERPAPHRMLPVLLERELDFQLVDKI
jgi:Caspase domain